MSKPSATIKQQPDDFQVAELLGFTPSGQGEHLWCYVEKTGLNTAYLKREWARLLGCTQKDIAHSGLKDRHAVTCQWLSLPAKYGPNLPDSGEGWRILTRAHNDRKLRIGTHRANEFTLILRDVQGERAAIDHALATLAHDGFANLFGEQRFGHHNLQKARHWVERGELPKKHDERALVLSTLRADCFNAQLQARMAADTLHTPQAGDRALLRGSNSHFLIDNVDDALLERLRSGDIALGGWLPGKENKPLPPATQTWLDGADTATRSAVHYLCRHADSGWRAFTARAQNLHHDWLDAHTLLLSFTLPRGSYATALLAAVFTIFDAAENSRT
ncbi:tRNA pseudouridine(13) synthase TruD [Cardiobacterium valvarum]|uniref:tRNA pseudouridine synthase D n=1 Tax=Cardiobacterium valvarum TaxID=194702 RepID=A0A381DY99_9GAMM|nr:tRNA pseudouridine(13) synthase TruD [Cardiobacterium valvarum]SUX18337.1 tRNA pseudouridine synthase D [Cardiobacterium valvarum]